MKYKKESLEKLLILIKQICDQSEYDWFKNALIDYLFEYQEQTPHIDSTNFEAFFRLLKKQFKIKAFHLYRDIPDKKLKSDLVRDCIKMYWHQINNDVEALFIQAFFQMENMLNYYVLKSNAFNKIDKNKNYYQHTFNEKFVVVCSQGFFYQSTPNPIEKINIWLKLVYWAYDTGNKQYLIDNNRNLSNMINVRNDNIHKDSGSEKKSGWVVSNMQKEDFTSFGFYINILKEIARTLVNLNTEVVEFPFEHTKVVLPGPKILGKINLK